MKKTHWLLRIFHNYLSFIMASLIFIMMIGGLVDISFRYLINKPIPGMSELMALGLGILVYGSLPLVTANNEHITVDLISWNKNRYVAPVVSFLVNVFSSLMLFTISWSIAQAAMDFASYGARSSFLEINLSMIAWVMSAMAFMCGLI
ncbi:MAG TPA: hypothetical protein DEQ25_11210, partial [Methylophaga sp.]|nr:hypothetical protein [Methylophaga sp.]